MGGIYSVLYHSNGMVAVFFSLSDRKLVVVNSFCITFIETINLTLLLILL
jgi:hypothetical protein